MRSFITCALIPLAVVSLGAVSSVSAAPTRTILVVDQSGSMDATDRTFLAQSAGMLYLGLAKKQDHVGLVRLGTRGKVVVPLGPADQVRREAWAYLHALDYGDPLTDIGDGLAVALRELTSKPSPGARDIVILLTDGKVDLGRARAHEISKEERRIRGPLMREYAASGVALYTVAFSLAAEQAFLKDLATSTGGQYRYVPDMSALDLAFTELFVAAADVDSLPQRDGGFMMDESVKKASLVVLKSSPDEQVRVVTPTEESLSPDVKRADINWTRTPAMDTVELDNPEAGLWGVKKAGSAQPLALVTDSALELKVALSAQTATLGDSLQVSAELLDEGERIKSYAKLEKVVFSVQLSQPDAEPITVQLASTGPGLFGGSVTPTRAGPLRLTVRAVGPALERQRTVDASIAAPRTPNTAGVEPTAEEPEASAPEPLMVTLGRPLAYMNAPLFLALGFLALTLRVWRKRRADD